jgi:hypothetical protein
MMDASRDPTAGSRCSAGRFGSLVGCDHQPGKDIYLVGGARTTASSIDTGLVDELRLILHPLIVGEGKALFATMAGRHELELRGVQQLEGGRVSLFSGIGQRSGQIHAGTDESGAPGVSHPVTDDPGGAPMRKHMEAFDNLQLLYGVVRRSNEEVQT